ncbi:hypothetical protein TSUD_152090 [Trifolium subterraneum]|uniref:Uncharacterized protein n=1 Tax=Trifolium subterraneum TaxID=3900 RepID=A0A2Z6MKK1_TRISU|nr:hypothetical protein TSUD_152090 [Trifolium subterraneum]
MGDKLLTLKHNACPKKHLAFSKIFYIPYIPLYNHLFIITKSLPNTPLPPVTAFNYSCEYIHYFPSYPPNNHEPNIIKAALYSSKF